MTEEKRLRKAVLVSRSKAQVLKHLGLAISGSAYRTLDNKIIKYALDTSHFLGQGWQIGLSPVTKIPTEDILVEDSAYTATSSLGKRLVREGLLPYKCDECKLEKWLGKPITLELDHINGKRSDNRIENLRLLCPNCHSQTDTYGSKKRINMV